MSKQFLYCGFIVLLFISSCKTYKPMTSSIKSLSSKKVIKAHQSTEFSKNTILAKIKTHYRDSKNSQTVSIKLRLKKDQVIWMSASYFGFPVAKVKITPTEVQYYEKLHKTYFEGDFRLISRALGADMNFQQLQNILLGQALLTLEEGSYKATIDKQSHRLIPKNQESIYSIFYWINPIHYKIDKQEIKIHDSNKTLRISYPEYQEIEGQIFPKNLHIKAARSNEITEIDMEFRNIQFNKTLEFPFSIPSGYKRIEIGDIKK